MISFTIGLLSFILFFNFTLIYLDDFKLSTNKYIRYLQILSPLFLLIFIYLIYYESIYNFNNILFVDDPNKNTNVSIGARVEIGKEAATELSKGISSVGSNIGLAGSVGAVTAGVAKVISKTSLPPMQKAGVVIAGSLIGGGIHVAASALNRLNNTGSSNLSSESTTNSTSTNIVNDQVNKLVSDSNTSDLVNLIFGINTITYACLSLIIILIFMILFKFYLNENHIKLNLSNLIGNKLNDNFNFYLIKIIKLNKLTSNIYIFAIFILLLLGLGFNCYFITELYNNLDKFISIHINK